MKSFLVLLLLLAPLAGCGGDSIEARVAALNSTRLEQLYNCYALYGHHNQFRGPADEASFKEFLRQPRYEKNLKRMQIDASELDKLFLGERDGEPYRIRYGVNGLGNKAVIFEAVGVDGKRWVALEEPVEVGAQEYDALWSGAKKPEDSAFEQQQGPPQDAQE